MRATVSAAALLWAVSAGAQTIVLSGPLAGAPTVGRAHNPAALVSNALVLPSGAMELGSELAFLTSGRNSEGRKLDFTDVGLLGLRARRALGTRVELFASTELLVKQRSDMHERFWQGGLLGMRLPFGGHFATDLVGSGGPLMGRAGFWWGFEPGLLGKFEIDRYTRFQLGLFDTFTQLELDAPATQPFFVNELGARVQLQAGDYTGGGWIGFDYHVPVASSPDRTAPDAATGLFLDPPVRLGVQVGGVVVLDEWTLSAIFTLVDRGELEHPETTLPILDGGFDQTQTTFGVLRRFGTQPD